MNRAEAAAAGPSAAVRAYALLMGAVCHGLFAVAVLAMMWTMAHGMTTAIGRAPPGWALAANALLLAQFPLLHSVLLGRRGAGWLKALAPARLGGRLAATTYVILASGQTLALFLLWTPSGVVWWRAAGSVRLGLLVADAAAWAMLGKAIWDAGLGLQTGWLGWRAVATGRPPRYPDMPTRGLFALIRQPIYLAFALTTWATPVWTPDQLAVAATLTGYCALGPLLKEARFRARYGERFRAYQAATPYWTPRLRRRV